MFFEDKNESEGRNPYNIFTIIRNSKNSSIKREKISEYSYKKKILFFILSICSLIVELEIYGGIKTISNFIKIEATRNPIKLFVMAMIENKIALVIMIFIALLLSKLIMDIFSSSKKEKVDERGFILDSNNEAGASKIMGDREKRELYKYLPENKPEGTILALDKKTNELLTIPFENSNFPNRNIALLGPPGMRKTSSILIPNVISNLAVGNSVLTTDPKGEIYRETYPIARHLGYNIRVLNILGTQFKNSDGWHALKMIRESDEPITAAQIFADAFLESTQVGANKEFWGDANTNCFLMCLLYVAKAESFIPMELHESNMEEYDNDEAIDSYSYIKQRTLKEVYSLITNEDLKEIISRAIDYSYNDKRLLQAPFNIWSKHREADSIRSGLGIKLNILQSPELSKILSVDDINFSELAEEKTIIYVICADNNETYKPILTLFITFLFREITAIADRKKTQKLDRPLYVILEEAGSIGKIQNMGKYISTVRSRNIGIMLCFQTLGQIKDIYGSSVGGRYEWETILAGCSMQLCLGGNDQSTNEYFSKRSGVMSLKTTRESEKRNKYLPESMQKVTVFQKSKMSSTTGRPTFFPDEIAHIQKDEILLSPATANVSLENKYFWKHHPLSNIKLIDAATGEQIVHLTKDHIPMWRDVDEFEKKENRYKTILKEDESFLDFNMPESFEPLNRYEKWL